MTENPYRNPPVDSRHQQAPYPKSVQEFAPCPECGSKLAEKVTFTWWGGLIGPKLFNHVRCANCRSTYNGKSGKSNFVSIVIYNSVGAVIAIAVLAWMFASSFL